MSTASSFGWPSRTVVVLHKDSNDMVSGIMALVPFVVSARSRSTISCLVVFYQQGGLVQLSPPLRLVGPTWWLRSCKVVPKARHKAFNSYVLNARSLWLQHNSRVFWNGSLLAGDLVTNIVNQCVLWGQARLFDRSSLFDK
jgi:hypothetical protein